MTITEEEARTKRCCGGNGCGRLVADAAGEQRRLCASSECMAWRWSGRKAAPPHDGDGFIPAPAPQPGGYCGLAGAV